MNPLMKNQQNSKEQEAFLHYIESEDIHLKTVDDCKTYLDYSYRFYGYPHHKVIEDLVTIAEDLEEKVEHIESFSWLSARY